MGQMYPTIYCSFMLGVAVTPHLQHTRKVSELVYELQTRDVIKTKIQITYLSMNQDESRLYV